MAALRYMLLVLLASSPLLLEARALYRDGFEPPAIAAQFPIVDGEYQLPSGPAADRFAWFLGELAAGETTTEDEINAHFTPGFVSQVGANVLAAFFNDILRPSWPDAIVTDLITVTPVRIVAVINSPGGGAPFGFVQFGARYTGAAQISQLQVANFGGNVIYPDERNLTLDQAVDRFAELSTAPALLVGRITGSGQCQAIRELNADAARATASVFKIWTLAASARMIADGPLAATEQIPMVEARLAPSGVINVEPLNTPFPARDLGILMMGISDNTATDLLHGRVGRMRNNAAAAQFGMSEPDRITPFLNISEQFHVFRSFPLSTAQSYVHGTEAFQQQFLIDEIEPLGRFVSGPYFHTELLTEGTWQATAFDVCRAFAALRQLPAGSEAIEFADAALSATAAQPNVRERFDRVWYKGGSLASGSFGTHVLNHVWMFENAGEAPYVVIAFSNRSAGGINAFDVQSILGRILELVADMP